MLTEQLKAIIIEKLIYEHDESTLQAMLGLLSSGHTEPIKLNEEQRSSIAEGLSDYKAGRFANSDDLERQDGEWL